MMEHEDEVVGTEPLDPEEEVDEGDEQPDEDDALPIEEDDPDYLVPDEVDKPDEASLELDDGR